MGLIARGDYSAHVLPRSEKDELGVSLQAMTYALREAAEKNEQHMWSARCASSSNRAPPSTYPPRQRPRSTVADA
ncbi:MAG: hypothetical protein ACXVW5_29370 [Solirubrobacteraceae bacterium]